MGKSYSTMNSREKRQLIQAANFDEEYIRRLYKRFKELDVNNRDALPLEDILNMSNMKYNPLVQRISEVFDIDSDGTISFTELLFGLAKLAENSDNLERSRFIFDIYDYDKDGYISNADLFNSIKIMVGDNLTDVQLQQLVDRAMVTVDRNGDELLSFPEFLEATSHIDFKQHLYLKR